MNRETVFTVINGECAYQEAMAHDENSHVVGEFPLGSALTAMRYNLELAEKAWYLNRTPHEETMSYLRKIAAIIVKQAEQNGMPERSQNV